jgi:uncharacterized protein (DUF433 family)
MELPEFLSIDDGGFIYVTGRRVGLHHVLRAYNEGLSPEEIALEYPSLQLSVIHKIMAYYLEHREAVDSYVTEHNRKIAEHMALSRPGPTIEELRARIAKRKSPPDAQRGIAG